MILSYRAEFELARKLRDKRGAAIAEVFTFLNGLYFRGKIAYATTFARPAPGMPGVLVITPTRGLVDARTRIRLDDLREFATVDIHKDDPRYRAPIERDARVLARKLPRQNKIILLGSIATGKYVNVLVASFGDRLRFPADSVGRGDMSRGGLLLRCAVNRRIATICHIQIRIRRRIRASLPFFCRLSLRYVTAHLSDSWVACFSIGEGAILKLRANGHAQKLQDAFRDGVIGRHNIFVKESAAQFDFHGNNLTSLLHEPQCGYTIHQLP
jgi:hypothetical protein